MMEILLKTVWEELADSYPGIALHDNFAQAVREVRILSGAEMELYPEVLYIDINSMYKHNFIESTKEASVILFGSDYEALPKHTLLVPKEYNQAAVANDVIAVFQRFQEWEASVLDAISRNKSLTDILNLSEKVTKDTVYMTDPSLKMLGYTTPTLMEEVSAIWQYQVKYGYMPMDIIRQLLDSGELDYINSTRDAFTYPKTCFNLPYTCKNIFKDNALQAHIFIVSVYSKPKQTHIEIAEALGRMLGVHLDLQPDSLTSFGTFHECFLRDILKEELRDYASIRNQLYYFNWSIDDSFSLVLIDLEDSMPIERRFLANQLESSPQLSCGVFDYEGYLVVLCHIPDKKTIQDTIYQYSIKYNFYAAISKVFNLLTDMSVYYEQTKRIITIGKNMSLENRIYFSEDYGLYSIISKLLEQNSIFEICHEGVLRLYELDQDNGTEYVSTLLEYLNNDRNVLRTSKILYIHRNTLLHRLEKICDIVDIDNCNAETRHFVLLSILILKYCTS